MCFLNNRGLRPCLLAAALTGSIIRLTRAKIFHVRPQGRAIMQGAQRRAEKGIFFSPSCKLKHNSTVTRFTGSHLLSIGMSGFRLRQAYAVTSRTPLARYLNCRPLARAGGIPPPFRDKYTYKREIGKARAPASNEYMRSAVQKTMPGRSSSMPGGILVACFRSAAVGELLRFTSMG